MFARVTISEGGSSESIDAGLRIAREQVLPKARQMDGWKGWSRSRTAHPVVSY